MNAAGKPVGPRRCVKQGPGRPIPDKPPEVIVLPPTDPATFTPSPPLLAFLEAYNAGDYRSGVEPLEELFFARRNTFHQGLLQYYVALLQLRGGRVRAARVLLRRSRELLAPYDPWQEGLDVAAILAHAEEWLGALPEDAVEMDPADLWELGPPPLHLTIIAPEL